MKRLFILLGVIISSFFFSSSFVKASTYEIPFSTSLKTYFDSSALSDFISSDNTNNNHYVVYQNINDSQLYLFYFDSSGTNLSCGVNYGSLSCSVNGISGNISRYYLDNNNGVYSKRFNTSTSATVSTMYYKNARGILTGTNYLIITDIPITLYDSNTYIIKDDDNSITCNSTSCNYISYNNFYNEFYYVPPPPDPTPLLTDFITITSERLQYICNYIISSYVFLSIFVIFILYFVVFLFRRLT